MKTLAQEIHDTFKELEDYPESFIGSLEEDLTAGLAQAIVAERAAKIQAEALEKVAKSIEKLTEVIEWKR